MKRPGGLGRGLAALLPSAAPNAAVLLNLPLTSLVPNPRQPRARMAEPELQELAESIRQVGVLQPIIVRPGPGDTYEIVAGERRFRAAGVAGLESIPAIVRHTEDSALLTEALVENVHRADLNPLEEASAYDQLLEDFGLTHEELASRLGKSRAAVSNALRLLGLPPRLQRMVVDGSLSAGHARALLPLPSAGWQTTLAEKVVVEGLSVRATEELVRKDAVSRADTNQPGTASGKSGSRADFDVAGLERRLEDALATRVRIRGSGRRGRVIIDYAGDEDLERLLEIVGRGAGVDLVRE